MKKPVFTGAGVAVITPMYEDGSVHFDELIRIIENQIENGTDAIIVCGTTGEGSTLTDEEKLACIRLAIETSNHRVPVVAGTGSNDTEHAAALSRAAADLGADALLLVTPYYNKTSQAGLIAHYETILEEAGIPGILYNVPSRTGVNLLPTTLAELCKNPLVNGVKEASGNQSQILRIRQLCGDELNIYSGNDDQITAVLAAGGKGVISVVSNVAPRLVHDCCQRWFAKDAEGCLAKQLELLPLMDALFCDVNPVPVKYAMNRVGWQAGECRLPLVAPSEEAQKRIDAALEQAGLL